MTPSLKQPPSRVLDIGGEGRHPDARNLNPSPVRTCGPLRGEPIPRHIPGRAEAIPGEDSSFDQIIVERTPLRLAAYQEIRRVAAEGATIILRHVVPPGVDPHRLARRLLGQPVEQRRLTVGIHQVQESTFVCRKADAAQAAPDA